MLLLTIVAVAGAIQGFLLLLSIICKRRHRNNLPLSLLLIVFSLRLATIPTWKEEVLLVYPWVYPLTSPLPFLCAPLLWWYVRELMGITFKKMKYAIPLFIPYFFELLAVIFTLSTMNNDEYAVFIKNVFSGNSPTWMIFRNSLKVIYNFIFLFFSGILVFGKKSKKNSVEKKFWLRSLVLLSFIILIFFAYVAVKPVATFHLSDGKPLPFVILSLTMLIFMYAISFRFMVMPEYSFFEDLPLKDTFKQLYTDIECKDLVEKLEKRFADGVFKDPNLSLSDLAVDLEVHPNKLSYAINNCCKQSFRSLLNNKRFEYFCQLVSSGSLKTHTMLSLAFEAGFSSKSTFNRFFKEKTGMSPSEYFK